MGRHVLQIGGRQLAVQDAICSFRHHEIRPTMPLLRYEFVTPWLPFSQNNYEQYRAMSSDGRAGQRDRLDVLAQEDKSFVVVLRKRRIVGKGMGDSAAQPVRSGSTSDVICPKQSISHQIYPAHQISPRGVISSGPKVFLQKTIARLTDSP
jgi:hypothetical protein